MTKCQAILEKKVKELTEKVKREMKFELNVLMFRDYMVKIEIVNEFLDVLLVFNLYYSPKKDSFRVVVEIEKDMMLGTWIRNLFQVNGVPKKEEKKDERSGQTDYIAYTDGSYLNGRIGYGAVLLQKDRVIKTFSGGVEGTESFRQVAGELEAVMQVVRFCEKKDISTVIIRFDYTGVRDWATDAWAAKNELTKYYKKKIQNTTVNVIWEKVDAHSGDYYNDMADRLAKEGTMLR